MYACCLHVHNRGHWFWSAFLILAFKIRYTLFNLQKDKYKDIISWIYDIFLLCAGFFVIWAVFIIRGGLNYNKLLEEGAKCLVFPYTVTFLYPTTIITLSLFALLLYKLRRKVMLRHMMKPPDNNNTWHAEKIGDHIIS
jgi:hypothetical protein